MHGGTCVLAVSGPLVAEDCESLELELEECIRTHTLKVVVEIGKVPFIDSDGLDKLLDMVSNLNKHGGDARVAGPNEVCKDIFKATRIDSFVQVYDDVDSALKSLL